MAAKPRSCWSVIRPLLRRLERTLFGGVEESAILLHRQADDFTGIVEPSLDVLVARQRIELFAVRQHYLVVDGDAADFLRLLHDAASCRHDGEG